MYIHTCIHLSLSLSIYIYIYIYISYPHLPRRVCRPSVKETGANDCTPEIDTSEIVVGFQWRFPMDFQWHFPTKFHSSVALSKGLSLVQWILNWNAPMDCQQHFPMDFHF